MHNIAVLCGGYTAERNISLQGADLVMKHIDSRKFRTFKIDIQKEDWIYLEGGSPVDKNDFSISWEGNKIRFDAAFIVIHGDPGENGQMQGYLEMLNIPYTNCNQYTSALTFNKNFCKSVVCDLGATCAHSILLKRKDKYNVEELISKLGLPLFVKPNKNGSSYGINKANDELSLKISIEEAFQFDDEVLLEEYIEGTEITCGIYVSEGLQLILPLTEIVSKHEFFNYTAKYTPGEAEEITPARISPQLESECKEISSRMYSYLNCKGVCRFDYILKNNEFYFLEVNTVPGMSENSIVPKQAVAAGISLTQLYDTLISECLAKQYA